MSENAMTTAEAAEYLGLSKGYMGILRHKGTGPTGTKEKGRVAYARSDLDAWKAGRMTTAEAAEYLGLSKGYMGILRHKGTGPAGTKEKGRVAYARSDLDAWKAGRSTAPAAAKGSRKPKAEATAGSARRAGKGPRGEGKKRAR